MQGIVRYLGLGKKHLMIAGWSVTWVWEIKRVVTSCARGWFVIWFYEIYRVAIQWYE